MSLSIRDIKKYKKLSDRLNSKKKLILSRFGYERKTPCKNG